MKRIADKFQIDRSRDRDAWLEEPQPPPTGLTWVDQAIGRRYRSCRFANFKAETNGQRHALESCVRYVEEFGQHVRDGVSLVFIGPKGTGKDHLMVSVLRAIVLGYPHKSSRRRRAVYRDGLRLFAEFRGSIGSSKGEDTIVGSYTEPHLLALSDPLPPTGSLSEYEQRMLLRIIDGRYRECRPTTATLNVANRDELDARMGAQAADRLLDGAIVVRCDWESYRMRKDRD
ncbi:MAG: ATP-binding protein [Planctomycetota bacterium]